MRNAAGILALALSVGGVHLPTYLQPRRRELEPDEFDDPERIEHDRINDMKAELRAKPEGWQEARRRNRQRFPYTYGRAFR